MQWRKYQIIPIIFLLVAVSLSIIAYIISGFNKSIFSVVILIVFASLYLLSYYLQDWIYEKGELILKEDEELMRLEKDNLIYHLTFLNGAGFAFLIPGLLEKELTFSIIGLIFLTIANLIYSFAYLPKQHFLIIKRKIKLEKMKNNLNKF